MKITIFIIFLSFIVTSANAKGVDLEYDFSMAQKYMAKHQYKKARKLIDKYTSQSAEFIILSGMLYNANNDCAHAVVEYDKATKIYLDNFENKRTSSLTRTNINNFSKFKLDSADCKIRIKNYKGAINDLKQLLKFDENNTKADYLLGVAYKKYADQCKVDSIGIYKNMLLIKRKKSLSKTEKELMKAADEVVNKAYPELSKEIYK